MSTSKKTAAVRVPRAAVRAAGGREAAESAGPGAAYHHGNLREALVEAGLKQLAASDSADLGLRELARQVGVSPTAAYRHFENKEALMAAMAAQGFRRLTAMQQEAGGDEPDPLKRLRAGGLAYVGFARAHPALFRLMFGRFSVAHRSEEVIECGQQAYEVMRSGVAQALGVAPDSPPVVIVATHAWSLVHGLSHLLLDGQLDKQTDDVDALVEAVLSQAGAVLRGASGTQPA